MPLDWTPYPRCKAYLMKQGDRLNDDSLNEYWAALNVASSFTEQSLKAFGGINFHVMKGKALLSRMEEFLEGRAGKKKSFAPKQKSPLDQITKGVSSEDIEKGKSPKGGWKRSTLMEWGVPWPAPQGWRKKLIKNHLGIK